MKTYNVTFTDKHDTVVSTFTINANNLEHARSIAQMHKRHTPEVKAAKQVKTSVSKSGE